MIKDIKNNIKNGVISFILKEIKRGSDKNKNKIYWNILNTGYVVDNKMIIDTFLKIMRKLIK